VSTYTCQQVREVAPELALGVLGGAERAEAVAHLTNCSRCQAYVAELTEAADILPLMVAEREPPPGFEDRVLAGLHTERRRSRRRWFLTVASVAAAAAIVSITLVRVIDARTETPSAAPVPTTATAPAPAAAGMTQARMVDVTDGAPAGWVYVSGGRTVALAIAYGVAPGRYDIEVHPAGSEPVTIGAVDVQEYRGSWMGSSPVAIGAGDTVSLVSATGTAVCHGTLTTTQ